MIKRPCAFLRPGVPRSLANQSDPPQNHGLDHRAQAKHIRHPRVVFADAKEDQIRRRHQIGDGDVRQPDLAQECASNIVTMTFMPSAAVASG